jgi:tetratricopeptide (TPR) repeat protein
MRTKIIFFTSFMLLVTASWMVPVSAQVDVSTGKKLIETYQWHKANSFFNDLVSKNPTDASLKFYLAETYMGLSKVDSAEALYNQSATENPELAFSQAGQGRIFVVKGDTVKAKEFFNKAIKSEKKNGDLYAYVAQACIGANQPKLAEQYIARGKEITMKNARIHMADGDLWRQKGNAGEAASAYERGIYYEKNLPLAYVKLGVIFTESKNFDISETNFKKALEIDPQYPLAFKGLGDMNYRGNHYKEASENYKKYVSLSEISLEDTYRYAFILFYNKEYAEATKIIEDLLVKDAKNPVLLRLKSYISYELGVDEKGRPVNQDNLKNALLNINQFFVVQGKNKYLPSDFEYLAKIQMANGLDTLAPANFKKAYALDSSRFSLLEDAAKAYQKTNRFDSAANAYQRLLNATQDNQSINYFNLGRMYYLAATKDTAKADSLLKITKLVLADTAFKKVSTLNPASYLGSLWMARSESQISQLDVTKPGSANASYEKLINIIVAANDQTKRKNELKEAYYYFASFYYVEAWTSKTKKKNMTEFKEFSEKSLEFWNKMLEITPEDPKALEGIKAVNDLNKGK